MTKPNIVRCIDLETTGQAPPAGVVEIAFCDVVREAKRWRVDGGWPRLVNPGHPIPPEASAIHHIVDEDVAGAMPWADAGAAAMLYQEGQVLAFAAHVARFERQWLTAELLGGRELICTYKAALHIWPDAPAHNLQTLRHWRQPIGLNRALADQAHRAYPDAYTTAHLLRDMLHTHVEDQPVTVERLIEWSSQPALLRTCQLGQYRGKPWSEVDSGYLEWILRPDKEFDEDIIHTARSELERRAAERMKRLGPGLLAALPAREGP